MVGGVWGELDIPLKYLDLLVIRHCTREVAYITSKSIGALVNSRYAGDR